MNYENLVNRIKQNDNSAIMEFYNKFYKEVYYVCYKITENEKDAEDVAQETLIKAIDKIDTLKNPEGLSAWLRTIANNLSINYLKKNRKFDIVDNSEDMGEEVFEENRVAKKTPEDIVADKEVTDILTNMINKLPREQRITIFMFYYEELSVKEIAEIMDCSEATVRSRINYARKALRKQVDELENKGVKLRCIAILPFLFTVYSFEKTGVCAAIAMPSASALSGGIKGSAESLMKAGKVAGEAAKMSLKAKIAIGAVAAVVLVGGTVGVVSLATSGNDDTNEVTDNSDLVVEEEKLVENEEDIQASYEELSLDHMEEYTYARSFFKAEPNEIGYVNIVGDDFVGTLDFSKSTIKPRNFRYDSVDFGGYTNLCCYSVNNDPYVDYSSDEELDASFIQDVVGDSGQAYFYKTESGYRTSVYYDDVRWYLFTNHIEEDEVKDKVISIIKCISKECVPDAPSTSEYVKNAVNTLKLDTVVFDFSNYELTTEAYVHFREDNGYKIYSIDSLGMKSLETNKYVSMSFWNGTNINSKIQTIVDTLKNETAYMYEVNVANSTIRVYERENHVPFFLGFISNGTEYLTAINTDMNIDELVDFLEKTIVLSE